MTLLSTTQWRLPAWAVLAIAILAVALLVLALVMGVLDARARRRSRVEVGTLLARVAELQERLDRVDRMGQVNPAATRGPAPSAPQFVITSLGETGEPGGAATSARPANAGPVSLTAPAFADAVLRESVVHTASFLHGVRRAFGAETRNRIRFEMRRELKRTRKERKVEIKEALREYRARHRAEIPADGPSRMQDGAA